MAIPFSIVDAGEAAAVVLLRSGESDAWMRGLAAFLRLPLACVHPGPGGFRVRLFALSGELEFSGTGLAAAAHAIWHAELVPAARPLTMLTASGPLEARRAGSGLEVAQAERVLFTASRTVTVARGELSWPP